MEQLRRAFRNEVHFALRLLVPPRSFLQTLATREKTDLPQFMYSTAPTQRSLYYFEIFIIHSEKKNKKKLCTFSEEEIYKVWIIKGSHKAGIVEICGVKLRCPQRISIYDWIYALEIQTSTTKV